MLVRNEDRVKSLSHPVPEEWLKYQLMALNC